MTQITSMVLFCRLRRGKLNSQFIIDFRICMQGELSLFVLSSEYTRDRKQFYMCLWGDHLSEERDILYT